MRGLVSSHTLRVVIAHAICACVTLAAVASAKAQDAAITLAIRQATAASLAKKYDLAIEIYSGALRIDDLSPSERRDLLRRRALENESANKQVESEADWKAAIAVEPVDPMLFYKRGAYYQRVNRYDDALADFAHGKTLDSNEAWFFFGEGEIRSARGEHRLAIGA